MMLKGLGLLLFVALVWIGLSAVVGEPDPWTAEVLDRIGFAQPVPGGEPGSAGQHARGQLLDAYRTGEQRAWLEDDTVLRHSGEAR